MYIAMYAPFCGTNGGNSADSIGVAAVNVRLYLQWRTNEFTAALAKRAASKGIACRLL